MDTVRDIQLESYGRTLQQLPRRQQEVIACLSAADRPMGAWEIAEKLKMPVHSVRPRLFELNGARVEPAGRLWHEATGRHETAWRIKVKQEHQILMGFNGEGTNS
jgi:predicted ArsR family transcriptional regulator